MRVKAKINIGRQDFAGGLLAGEECSVPEPVAVRMIRRGWVVEVPGEEEPSEPVARTRAKK